MRTSNLQGKCQNNGYPNWNSLSGIKQLVWHSCSCKCEQEWERQISFIQEKIPQTTNYMSYQLYFSLLSSTFFTTIFIFTTIFSWSFMPFTLEKGANVCLFTEMKSKRSEDAGMGRPANNRCHFFWLSG